MAITYTWKIGDLSVHFNSASLENVVTHVNWEYTATTEGTSSLGVSGSFEARDVGNQALDPVASADFTAYDSLTKDEVLGWVTASLQDQWVTQIETRLSSSLAWQLNPTTGQKNTPW